MRENWTWKLSCAHNKICMIHKNCSRKLQCLHNNSTGNTGATCILIPNLSQQVYNVYNINEKYVYLSFNLSQNRHDVYNM